MSLTLSPFATVALGSSSPAWWPVREQVVPGPGQMAGMAKAAMPREKPGPRGTLPEPIAMERPVRPVNEPKVYPRDVVYPRDAVFPETVARPAVAADPAKAAEQEAAKRLVLLCLSGDRGAWQQLVGLQHRRIYGICYRFTGSATDAEDLTQEVFLKLYRSLGSFDPAKGAFSTWLTTLTRNLLVDHFRRTRQDRVTDSLDVTVSGEEGEGPTRAEQLPDGRRGQYENVAQMQMRARIQHALRQLSPELREAVILRDLQDMDYKEIAAVLRVPEGTVKSRISRGRGELARVLGREGLHRAGDTPEGRGPGLGAGEEARR